MYLKIRERGKNVIRFAVILLKLDNNSHICHDDSLVIPAPETVANRFTRCIANSKPCSLPASAKNRFYNALKGSSQRVIDTLGYEHELTYFFRYLIHYAIENEQEAERIYRAERVKHEKSILLSQVSPNKKKRKGKRL